MVSAEPGVRTLAELLRLMIVQEVARHLPPGTALERTRVPPPSVNVQSGEGIDQTSTTTVNRCGGAKGDDGANVVFRSAKDRPATTR